ncbi:hypothetical protein [Methylobacterium brachythecii]|uniref:Argininosuccinate lyase n=1 Tax=Methylobacterium brachythecii TaxID=1176177 RepID=A0A7W6AJD8_9HYPH|nr:hypothetical protein [Methylobacterium brachythecii]MBB3902249.1 hypothetical protein [Methylobacterium brachythecii]GLS42095.1 hypothetical protein GCM10007884_00800 [Methylobacterium brachythecii]
MLTSVIRLTALAAIFAPGLAMAQAKQDFTIVNKTGYQIDEVYVGPVSSSNWGKDVMGKDAIGDGESAEINLQGGGGCKWDIRVVYNDGDASEFREVNLCNITQVTLFWNRKAGTTRFVAE